MARLSKAPLQVYVTTLHDGGYGLSGDSRIAVLGALPGETLTALPFSRRRKKTYCRIESIESASVDRVEPACSVAGVCGGCSFQHMEHRAQIEFKQTSWLTNFVSPPEDILPPLLGPTINYRSKARLGARFVTKKGKVLVGFREKMKGFITETKSCKTLRLPAGELLEPLAEMLMELSDPQSVPQIEVAIGDATMAFVIRHLGDFTDADLGILQKFSEGHQVQIYLQPSDQESVHRLCPDDGDEYLYYDLVDHDLRIFFTPLDFTQVNHGINQSMVNLAIKLLAPGPDDEVLDAFCGIGNFSLAIARVVRHVTGLDFSATSVERAEYNAKTNGIENVRFLSRDLFTEQVVDLLEPVSHVLLDPPRSGAETLVKTLAESNVKRVVYVSCNPQTLARDVEILINGGYHFDKAGVIDMFPHTTHIESISVFSR